MEIEHLHLNHGGDLYNNEVLNIKNFLTTNPNLIFDIGANVGGFSIALHKNFPTAQIHSFEPVKLTYDLLKNNTKHINQIQTHHIGLSNETLNNVPIGMPKIPNFRKHNYGRATIKMYDGDPIDYISLRKFSDFCSSLGENIYPDFMKIDAEGCEYEILKDAETFGILQNIKLIYIEINNNYNTTESAQKSKTLLLKYFDIVGDSGFNQDNNEPLNYIFKNNKL